MQVLDIYAGKNALARIKREGFSADLFDYVLGASGGPKWFVLFGLDNQIDKSYNADALSKDGKIVIEVEAGRATENNQYMKDIFQACMMFEVEYLIVAVRNTYRGHNDFNIVYTFLETLYISSRLHLPLKGILLIGY